MTVKVAAGEEGHTATFPRNLIVPRILSSSPPGGVVLDPFCGTGRALEVAKEFGRLVVGFEKFSGFQQVAQTKVSGMAKATKGAPRDVGNYISEWFGHEDMCGRVVRLGVKKPLTGAKHERVPIF